MTEQQVGIWKDPAMNQYNPGLHHRRSIRLKDFDYTQPGQYFLTLCTQNMECLFGDLVGNEVTLNAYGRIIESEWLRTPLVRDYVVLDLFMIMPNHMHMILGILDVGATRWVAQGQQEHQRATCRVAPTGPAPGSIGAIIGQFKSRATKQINRVHNTQGMSIWQRNYYEHIVRNEKSHCEIRDYILNNPARWLSGKENLDFILPPFVEMIQRS